LIPQFAKVTSQRKPPTVHFSAERLRFSVEMQYQMDGPRGERGGTGDLREENPNAAGGPGKESECDLTGELLRCRSSFASASSNPAPPPVSQRYSFCGKRSPTSDSRIAATRTSSCTAWPRLHGRNGNNTSASWEPTPKLETGWPGQLLRRFPEGLRFESPAGFCGLVMS
jgi:hypothetical protein